MPRKANAMDAEDARMKGGLLDLAEAMSSYGVMSKRSLAKVRTLANQPPSYSPEQVVRIRKEVARMSQDVFATVLNVSKSTLQKWEAPGSGKHPSGAAAKLLQLVETKGVDVLFA